MASDNSKNESDTPKPRIPSGGPGAGVITKEIVLQTLEDICRQRDRAYGNEKTGPTFDQLKQDCNLEGLVHYVAVEIDGAKLRDLTSHFATVSKHQYVFILSSFLAPSRKNPHGTKNVLTVIEDLTDFMMTSMNR